MDVSQPNNWPRIEELCKRKSWGGLDELGYGAVTDEQTAETLRQMDAEGYLCEPHGAIAYRILTEQLEDGGETGMFLCTAHPAKFKEVVDEILEKDIDLPAPASETQCNGAVVTRARQ